MTTLLDIVNCASRNCVHTDGLRHLSTFSESPSTETKDGKFSFEDEPFCLRSPPCSSQTSFKDVSSPASSELPSMPSEKSASRDFSSDSLSNCQTSSEKTDNERSNSDCSSSPSRFQEPKSFDRRTSPTHHNREIIDHPAFRLSCAYTTSSSVAGRNSPIRISSPPKTSPSASSPQTAYSTNVNDAFSQPRSTRWMAYHQDSDLTNKPPKSFTAKPDNHKCSTFTQSDLRQSRYCSVRSVSKPSNRLVANSISHGHTDFTGNDLMFWDKVHLPKRTLDSPRNGRVYTHDFRSSHYSSASHEPGGNVYHHSSQSWSDPLSRTSDHHSARPIMFSSGSTASSSTPFSRKYSTGNIERRFYIDNEKWMSATGSANASVKATNTGDRSIRRLTWSGSTPQPIDVYNYRHACARKQRQSVGSSNELRADVQSNVIPHQLNCQRSLSRSAAVYAPLMERLSSLLHDSRLYLHDPIVSFPLDLYPPNPPPRKFKSESLSRSNMNDNSMCQKYSCFPFNLRSSKPPSSDEEVTAGLSKVTNREQVSDFSLQENFLTHALDCSYMRSERNFNFVQHCPISPQPACDDEQPQYFPSGRVSPILKCRSGRSSPLLVKTDEPELIPRGTSSRSLAELTVSTDMLEPNTPRTCHFCLMQIIPVDNAVHWRFSETSYSVPFCSASCFLAYKSKHLTDVHPFHTSPLGSMLSCDGVSQVPVLIQSFPSKPRVISKRNETKNSRKRAIGDPPIVDPNCHHSEILGRRWDRLRWQRFADSATPVKRVRRCKQNLPHDNTSQVPEIPCYLPVCSSDTRFCYLCHRSGDLSEHIAGRLINCDIDVWVHVNCILWCYDVYETVSGGLVHVSRSFNRAMQTSCVFCGSLGAGLPCFDSECPFVYHLPCAYEAKCVFYADRGMYCPDHQYQSEASFSPLRSLAVDRRVFIDRDEDIQVANVICRTISSVEVRYNDVINARAAKLRIGSVILHTVGQLLPEQLESGQYHNVENIYPVGYSTTRIYWSCCNVGKRSKYDCQILDRTEDPKDLSGATEKPLKFVVTAIEDGKPMEQFQGSSCTEVWYQVVDRINDIRRSAGRLRIFKEHINGELLYGLKEPHIVRAIESLPGVDRLVNYNFKFSRLQLIHEMPLAVNPTGCARSEPKLRTHVRTRSVSTDRVIDTNSLRQMKHGKCAPLRSSFGGISYVHTGLGIPSKSQQYRRLRAESRLNVVLARSKIQGLGLYAARDISTHSFIIEYLGELIRNEVGNRRERLYDSQHRGTYMFRVDDDCIVDATMCGGLARYINHSCQPNCSAEVLNCDNGSHIIIIAKRFIEKGEELTYDYQFDLEEDRWDRIPCLCGASNCRNWMN